MDSKVDPCLSSDIKPSVKGSRYSIDMILGKVMNQASKKLQATEADKTTDVQNEEADDSVNNDVKHHVHQTDFKLLRDTDEDSSAQGIYFMIVICFIYI